MKTSRTDRNNNTCIKPRNAHNSGWVEIIQSAKKDDYLRLLNTLTREAIGTGFDRSMQIIASNWLDELQCARTLSARRKTFMLGRLSAHIWFIHSLSAELRAFMGILFSMPTTMYVAYDEDENEFIAVTSNPSADNIQRYSKAYANALVAGCEYFRFMVHGEEEMKYKQAKIKVTRGDWNAIS